MDEDVVAEYADVFAALADDTRLDILLSIMEAASYRGPLSYSEAMAAADVEDSGKFNYHLGKLQENFVYEFDGEYYPTTAAWDLYTPLLSGRLRDNDLEPRAAPLDVPCMACGRRLEASYDYEFTVRCTDCERVVFGSPVGPEVGAEADLAALARELDRTDRQFGRLLLGERCISCGGEGTVTLTPSPPHAWAPTATTAITACETCGEGFQPRSIGQLLLVHPAVVEYAEEHGIDLEERPQWAYQWCRDDTWTTVHAEDPWEIEQWAYVDGCRLVAEIGEGGEVTLLDHARLDGKAGSRRSVAAGGIPSGEGPRGRVGYES